MISSKDPVTQPLLEVRIGLIESDKQATSTSRHTLPKKENVGRGGEREDDDDDDDST